MFAHSTLPGTLRYCDVCATPFYISFFAAGLYWGPTASWDGTSAPRRRYGRTDTSRIKNRDRTGPLEVKLSTWPYNTRPSQKYMCRCSIEAYHKGPRHATRDRASPSEASVSRSGKRVLSRALNGRPVTHGSNAASKSAPARHAALTDSVRTMPRHAIL